MWRLQQLNAESEIWLEEWNDMQSLNTKIEILLTGNDLALQEDKLINNLLSRLLKKIKVISDIERIIGAECPLCGTLAVNTVRSTLLDYVEFPFVGKLGGSSNNNNNTQQEKQQATQEPIQATIGHQFLPRRRLDCQPQYFKKNARKIETVPFK
jgi:hypothetical protein